MIIWIDNKTDLIAKEIEHLIKVDIFESIFTFSCLDEFSEWRTKNCNDFTTAKIITNTYRETDWGKLAAIKTISYVKSDEQLKDCPILIYTSNKSLHKNLYSPINGVWLADLPYEVASFISRPNLVTMDKFMGCVYGLVVGDVYGSTYEFMKGSEITLSRNMEGGGPFGLEKGEWTDDTSMMLCMMKSLIQYKCYCATDIMDKFVMWKNSSYMSSQNSSRCIDIGVTTRNALTTYEKSDKIDDPHIFGSLGPNSAGNGSIMRLCPIPLFYSSNMQNALTYSGLSSMLTHRLTICVEACKLLAELIVMIAFDKTEYRQKDEYLKMVAIDNYTNPEIRNIITTNYAELDQRTIMSTGYVIHSLQTALYSFLTTNTFEEGMYKTCQFGDDTDTNCAIYGQIAGCYYGYSSIPERWVNDIKGVESRRNINIKEMIEQLYETATSLDNF